MLPKHPYCARKQGLAAQLADKDRPAMLYFCFNPSVIAVVIAHCLEDGEFVAQVPYFPPLQVLTIPQTPIADGSAEAVL